MEKLSSIESSELGYNNKKKAWAGRRQLIKLSFGFFIVLIICYLIIKYAISCSHYTKRLNDLEILKQNVNDSTVRMRKATQEIESQLQTTKTQKIEIENIEVKIGMKETNTDEFNSEIESLKKQKLNYESRYEELVIELQKAKSENDRLKEGSKETKNQSIINPTIIQTEEEKNLIERWINQKIGKICYEFSEGLLNVGTMLQKCKNAAPTIILVKTVEGLVIGGYTSISWNEPGIKSDVNAFIFSLTNKTAYYVTDKQHAIVTGGNYISFGDDLIISSDFCLSKFPFSYGDKYHNNLEDLFGNNKEIKISRFEVITIE